MEDSVESDLKEERKGRAIDQVTKAENDEIEQVISGTDDNTKMKETATVSGGRADESELSQLEQQIIATHEIGNLSRVVSSPGANSAQGGAIRSHRGPSQLEQDTIALRERGNSGKILAGNDGDSGLSKLEQDILAMHEAGNPEEAISRPAGKSIPAENDSNGGLHKVEPELIAKQQGETPSNMVVRSGVVVSVPVATVNKSIFRQLEHNAIAAHEDEDENVDEATLRHGSISESKPKAGVSQSAGSRGERGLVQMEVPSGPMTDRGHGHGSGGSLNQLEHDLVAKAGSSRKDAPGSKPGAFFVPRKDNSIGDCSSLNQIEQELIAKSRHSGAPSSRTGVFPVPRGGAAIDGPRSLHQLEEDICAKERGAPRRVTAMGVGLDQLEQDIVTKRTEQDSTEARIVGVVPVSAGSSPNRRRADLRNLEDDVLAKRLANSAREGAIALEELESEVVAKSRTIAPQPPEFLLQQPTPIQEVSPAALGLTPPDSIHSMRSMYTAPSNSICSMYSARDDAVGRESAADYQSQESQSVNDAPIDPSTPVCDTDSTSSLQTASVHVVNEGIGVDHNGRLDGVQAFLTHTVVDATGVAVVMPEEELDILEQQKFSRRLRFGFICFLVIIIAIAVPVAVVLGRNGQAKASKVFSSEVPSSEAPSQTPSMAPTSSELRYAIEFLISEGISDSSAFRVTDSHQYQAVQWLVNEDPAELDFRNKSQVKQWLTRYCMSVFYFSTNGDEWKACGRSDIDCSGYKEVSWLISEDECRWFGCSCDDDGMLIGIIFAVPQGNYLAGPIPKEFFQLTELQNLNFRNNKLSGTFSDSWSALTNLRTLSLPMNNFDGPLPNSFLQNATKISQLDLGGNSLEGSIPESLYRVGSNMRALDLGYNQFSGSLSPLIGRLQILEKIDLNSNGIGGELPQDMFGIISLKKIRIGGCSFAGTLSENVARLTNLNELFLENNAFTGKIPGGLDSLTDLDVLSLHGNQFNGSVSLALCSRHNSSLLLSVDCDEVRCSCCGNRECQNIGGIRNHSNPDFGI